MPTGGVGSHFVQLLEADRRAIARRIVVMAIVAVLLLVPAYLIYPWQGVGVHAVGLLCGLLVGSLASRRRTAAYEASLRSAWNAWMKHSVAQETMLHTYRRVTGRSNRNIPYLAGALLTVLWAVEVALLVLAFKDTEAAALAIPVLLFQGIVTGVLLGQFLHQRGWYRDFSASVREMVGAGELGVWGVI